MYKNGQGPISLTLSPAQVDEVLQAATQSRAPSISMLIADALSGNAAAGGGAGLGADGETAGGSGDDGTSAEESGPAPAGHMPSDTSDRRLSRSLLRGLSILTCFGPSGEERGIVELSRDLGMSASTAHRYAVTLVELGLLERCPRSRKYRLPALLMT